MHRATLHASLVALAAALVPLPALSQDGLSPAEQRGRNLLHSHCSRCHAVDRTGTSPLQGAPPFRTLHQRYPVESLEEPLAEGIVTGHPEMPEFRFDPNQIGDIIGYLKSLQR